MSFKNVVRQFGWMSSVWVAVLFLMNACETSSNSGNGTANINFSGSYKGTHHNNEIAPDLEESTNQNVHGTAELTTLYISQSGDSLSVTDNRGSQYSGSMDTTEVASVEGDIQPGEEMAHASIDFSGYDNAAKYFIHFSGTLKVVATAVIEPEVVHTGDIFSVTAQLNEDPASSTNAPDNGSTNQFSSIDAQLVYTLTSGNTRYILEGTWSQEGGRSDQADAAAPGAGGTIVFNSVSF
jgi:hypothetical protein